MKKSVDTTKWFVISSQEINYLISQDDSLAAESDLIEVDEKRGRPLAIRLGYLVI